MNMMEFLVPVLILTLALFPFYSQQIEVELTNINQITNAAESELIQNMVRRSHNRFSYLTSKLTNSPSSVKNTQAPVQPNDYEYLMELSIGTPPMNYSAIMDTGSDLTWTQCEPCPMCHDQPQPLFDPSHSSTYRELTCSDRFCEEYYRSLGTQCSTCEYTYAYIGDSFTEGMLASETFTIGDSSIANISFGCGHRNFGGSISDFAGIVGLGRGSFSLTSQLGIDKFSYCLTPPMSQTKSLLTLGPQAKISNPTEARTISLAQNPPNETTFYHITLRSILVGKTLIILNSTSTSQNSGTGNMVIDSGTSLTFLEQELYETVMHAFVNQMNLQIGDGSDLGLDLCFVLPTNESVSVPELVIQFEGDNLEFDPANYFMVDSSSGLMCLMMAGSDGSDDLQIFGNILQQNMEILYDMKEENISFQKANCGENVRK